MMTCLNEVTLQAYFDGELEPAVAANVNKHLAKCDACAANAFEFERAIELMASAFEDELPDSVPSQRLRARIEAALVADARSEGAPASASFWQRVLDGPIEGLRRLGFSPRGFVYASLGAIVLIFALWGLWLGFTAGGFSRKETQAQNDHPQDQTPAPSPAPGGQNDNQLIGNQPAVVKPKSAGVIAGSRKLDRQRQSPLPRDYQAVVNREPASTLPGYNPDELVVGTSEVGIFDAEMVRHFEKAQLLLRSFRNSDTSTEGFEAELEHERRQSKSLLYQNILLRRDAESRGILPAEEVLGSLEPVLLDIANLPDRPSPYEVRSIKDRIHKKEIIGVLQVYSAPLTATNYQPN